MDNLIIEVGTRKNINLGLTDHNSQFSVVKWSRSLIKCFQVAAADLLCRFWTKSRKIFWSQSKGNFILNRKTLAKIFEILNNFAAKSIFQILQKNYFLLLSKFCVAAMAPQRSPRVFKILLRDRDYCSQWVWMSVSFWKEGANKAKRNMIDIIDNLITEMVAGYKPEDQSMLLCLKMQPQTQAVT